MGHLYSDHIVISKEGGPSYWEDKVIGDGEKDRDRGAKGDGDRKMERKYKRMNFVV